MRTLLFLSLAIAASISANAQTEKNAPLNSAVSSYVTLMGLSAKKLDALLVNAKQVSVNFVDHQPTDISCMFNLRIRRDILGGLDIDSTYYEKGPSGPWENSTSIKLQGTSSETTYNSVLKSGSGDEDLLTVTIQDPSRSVSYQRLYVTETVLNTIETRNRITIQSDRWDDSVTTRLQHLSRAGGIAASETKWCTINDIEINADGKTHKVEDFLPEK